MGRSEINPATVDEKLGLGSHLIVSDLSEKNRYTEGLYLQLVDKNDCAIGSVGVMKVPQKPNNYLEIGPYSSSLSVNEELKGKGLAKLLFYFSVVHGVKYLKQKSVEIPAIFMVTPGMEGDNDGSRLKAWLKSMGLEPSECTGYGVDYTESGSHRGGVHFTFSVNHESIKKLREIAEQVVTKNSEIFGW